MLQDTAELFFEDCRLPADALLGGEASFNRGFYQLMQELPQERLLIANLCLGACEFMFEETRDYVKQRKAFGKTLSKLQTIQHTLAEIKTEVRNVSQKTKTFYGNKIVSLGRKLSKLRYAFKWIIADLFSKYLKVFHFRIQLVTLGANLPSFRMGKNMKFLNLEQTEVVFDLIARLSFPKNYEYTPDEHFFSDFCG